MACLNSRLLETCKAKEVLLCLALILFPLTPTSRADDLEVAYPSRYISVVMGFAAGSGADAPLRLFASYMSEGLKQQVIIVPAPGAAGAIAADQVSKAAADGYTLGAIGSNVLTTLPLLNPNAIRFDPLSDLIPIAGLISGPPTLAVPFSSPAKNIGEFIDMVRKKPGQLNYGSGGLGSPQHLAAELLLTDIGGQMIHVPYKGVTPGTMDLVAGRVDMMFLVPGVAQPLVDAKQIRLLAHGGLTRSPFFPDVPTLDESGVKGFEYSSWFALFAPKGTPNVVIERLRAEVKRVAVLPELRSQLHARGVEYWDMAGDKIPGLIREETRRWQPIIRDRNIRLE